MERIFDMPSFSSSFSASPVSSPSVPFHVCTAAQAREADSSAIQTLHIPSLVLMENAARACCAVIEHLFETRSLFDGAVWIVCGPGNNGADGLAIARLLSEKDIETQIFIREDKLSGDEAVQLSIVRSLHLPVHPLDQLSTDLKDSPRKPVLLVDALFGNGLSRDLKDPFASIIEAVNTSGLPVLAVDLPSGIDSDTGKLRGAAVRADWTVALDCLKWGHLLTDGRRHAGNVIPAAIGIPACLHADDGSIPVIDPSLAASFLPKRTPFGNKGRFGKVLLAGGSFSMQGALSMAAQACFQCGCGTLTLFTPEPAARAIASKLDLAMILPAPADPDGFFETGSGDRLETRLPAYSCLGCGNGMGQSEGALEVLRTIIQAEQPAVLDADAINLLASHPDLLAGCSKPLILTPHLMEFSRLIQKPLEEVLRSPLELGRRFVQDHPHTVLVLKSDFTLVLSAGQEAVLNRPNSALSKGGSGDVLCGIVTGLYSMKMDPFQAAVLGVYLHNAAADQPISPFSFTPLDLIRGLSDVFLSLEQAGQHTGLPGNPFE